MKDAFRYLDRYRNELEEQYVCISNVRTTVMVYRDSEYCAIQNGSELNFLNGKSLSMLQRYRGYHNADWVFEKKGGYGAVRDLYCELYKERKHL